MVTTRRLVILTCTLLITVHVAPTAGTIAGVSKPAHGHAVKLLRKEADGKPKRAAGSAKPHKRSKGEKRGAALLDTSIGDSSPDSVWGVIEEDARVTAEEGKGRKSSESDQSARDLVDQVQAEGKERVQSTQTQRQKRGQILADELLQSAGLESPVPVTSPKTNAADEENAVSGDEVQDDAEVAPEISDQADLQQPVPAAEAAAGGVAKENAAVDAAGPALFLESKAAAQGQPLGEALGVDENAAVDAAGPALSPKSKAAAQGQLLGEALSENMDDAENAIYGDEEQDDVEAAPEPSKQVVVKADSPVIGADVELEYGMQIALTYSAPDQKTVGGNADGRGGQPCQSEGCYVAFVDEMDKSLHFTADWRQKQLFFVRQPALSAVQGCVQFGHKVVLARSKETKRTQSCGWYGCQVASMGGGGEMAFSKGLDEPTAFFVRPVPSEEEPPDGQCVKFGDQVVLAMSHENERMEKCGWYGCAVAGFDKDELKMKIQPGGMVPSGFFVRSAPPAVVSTVDSACEAQGVIVAPHTRMQGKFGQPMVDKHPDKTACRVECMKLGAFYYSYKIKSEVSQCRCGRKGKSFAWLLAQTDSTVNPWFKNPSSCDQSRPDVFCTEGTSCKRCLLLNQERMDEEQKNINRLGDCKAVDAARDCESLEKGTWLTVHQKECFQSCRLAKYDGMPFKKQRTIELGQCRPLYSLNATKCEDWSEGVWETVSKGDCSASGGWSLLGHFEDKGVFDTSGSIGLSTKWKLRGEVGVKRSKGTELFHPISWLQLQNECQVAKTKFMPGEAVISVPTMVGGSYALVFQAASAKDWDTNGLARGHVTVDGMQMEFATTALYNGLERFEWANVEVSFVAKGQTTNLIFSEPGQECILVREVALYAGQSFQVERATWQTPSSLMLAFNRIGCPASYDAEDDIFAKAVDTWRKDESKALTDMWWTCEQARAGSVGRQHLCCGKGKTCTPQACNVRGKVEDQEGRWTQWLWLKNNAANQSGTQGDGFAYLALDQRPDPLYAGSSCIHTEFMANPWWSVKLGAIYDISAVRITNCKDCTWDAAETPLEIFISGQSCIRGVVIAPGETKDIPCIGTGHEIKVQLLDKQAGELTLCEVGVQVSGKANPRQPAKCPFELSKDHFMGTGNVNTGYMKKGQYLVSKQTFRRPVTIEAELRADQPECLGMNLFALDHSASSGYSLQTGVSGNWSLASPGADNRAITGNNDVWHKVKMEVTGPGNIYYSINGVPFFQAEDKELSEGALQFVAGCVSGRVRNVYVHSSGMCAVSHRSCAIKLPLAPGSDHWQGTGNAALGTLEKGELIQSKAKFTRPLIVRAEMRADHAACAAMQILGDDSERGAVDTGYSLSTGVNRYQAVVQPGAHEISAGTNQNWHWVEINAAADGNVYYYLNNKLIKNISNSTWTIGRVRIVASCVAVEVRNVAIETQGNCQVKPTGQPHEIWMAAD